MNITYCEAIQKAFFDAMSADENIVFFGEDDRNNLYGYTERLYDSFGAKRVIDIPLSESGAVGLACGAAICGLRTVVDLTTENFLYVAMDQICSIAAKTSYMYDGAFKVPITIFASAMYRGGNAAQHSDRLHSMFMNVPGLKIITPAFPQDMYSLLKEAIADDSPVLCFADRACFWLKEDIDFEREDKIGKALLKKVGNDITLISVAGAGVMALEAADNLKAVGIDAEVIDIRSVVPLDIETVIESVSKTGRIVVCDTACRTGSTAGHISSVISRYAFKSLKAPIGIATAEDIPVPYAKNLEDTVVLSADKIYREAVEIMGYKVN